MVDKLACVNDELRIWGGSHWEVLKEQTVRSFIQRQYGDLKYSSRYSDHKQIVQVVKDLVPQVIKTNLTDGINFANGFLTRDLKLMPHAAEYGMTYTLPFCYKPELVGKCPRFLDFLTHSWGHDDDFNEKKRALQEAICATLFGIATSFQRCFLLYGAGNTGKSVMIEILKAMVPDEAQSAIGPDQWGETFIPAQFAGKLLNVAGELHENKRIEGKSFKEIVSGEEITAQHKNQNPFRFRPKAAHWFASNYLPRSKDTSGGFNRRWLILQFNRIVAPKDIVRDLHAIIIYEEIEAIVAWALEALPPFLASGNYTMPSSSAALAYEVANLNSSVRQWLGEKVIEAPGEIVTEEVLYKDYWMHASSVMMTHAASPKVFSVELRQFLGETSRLHQVDVNGSPALKNIMLRKVKS